MQNPRGLKYSIAAIVVVVLGGLVAWRAFASRQPRLDASGEKLRSFVASDKFKELPQDQKKRYADAMFEKGIDALKGDKPSSEQEAAIHNVAQTHLSEMLDGYFQLPEGKDRKDYLDKQIDQQEKIKKLMENPPTTKPGDGPRIVIKRGGGAAQQKAMAESMPPDQQAKMAQYMKDLQARRAERGLPPGPGGIMMIRTNTGPK
jgi:hypothetical protein